MKSIKKELQAIKESLEEIRIKILALETSIKLMEMSQKPIVFQGSVREQSSENK